MQILWLSLKANAIPKVYIGTIDVVKFYPHTLTSTECVKHAVFGAAAISAACKSRRHSIMLYVERAVKSQSQEGARVRQRGQERFSREVKRSRPILGGQES